MSKLTEVLKLLCYDPETDGNLTFNVTEALTKNWEKIDAWASGIKSTIVGLVPGTRKVNGKVLSEDLTLTGEDIKVSGSDETSISSSLSNKQDLIWLGIAEMDADLNDLKQIGTTAIHGTSKNVPPDVSPENWGLLTVSANSKATPHKGKM